MKKIFLIFVCFLILVSCMVIPSFASMPSSFSSYSNILSFDNWSVCRFYSSPDTFKQSIFYDVQLKPNTDYTFISTEGVKRFYFGQIAYDDSNYRSVYSFDSLNLLDSSLFDKGTRNGVTLTYEDGYVILNGTATSGFSFGCPQYISFINGGYISAHYISGSTSNTIYLSASNGSLNQSCYLDTGDTFESQYFPYDSISLVYIWIDSGTTFNNFKFKVQVSEDYLDSYYPYYTNPVFVDSDSSVITFNTGYLSNNAVIGLYDINYDPNGYDSALFTNIQSDSNKFYLVEGKLTVDEISNIIDNFHYQDAYDTGYDDGYKIGETDGLSSTSFMRSTIFTILSAPFVIVSNALDFDLLGINIYNLVKISITVLLIAWVITRLKGRE